MNILWEAWDWLRQLGNSAGWFANLIQIGAVAYVVVGLWRARRAYLRRRRMLELKPVEGAVAFAVGVGTHIEAPVTQFLVRRFGTEAGQPKVPLVKSYDKAGFIPTGNFLNIIREIRDDIDELRRRGDIREVHLFYAGPYAIAAGIGAIVDNWVPVHVYMYNNKTSEYEMAFTLSAETVKGI
jgi:hypothetical protein